MEEYIDLHTHSTASDGMDSPAELVAKARETGLAAMALTDHDTLAGLREAEEASRELGQMVIPGCEISTITEHGEMHILGLWIPENSEPLEEMLAHFRRQRISRNEKIVQKLRDMGIAISMDDVLAHAQSSVGRPHIAAVLLEKGYVKTMQDAFLKYLGVKGSAYVPKIAPRPEQAVRILNSLGASVILAHPLLRKSPAGWLEGLAAQLAKVGLTGLEAWHSAQSREDSDRIVALARSLGLGLSGGSDYHGANKPGIELGSGRKGNVRVPASILDDLLARRKAKGLPC